jgi:hypothetical protein
MPDIYSKKVSTLSVKDIYHIEEFHSQRQAQAALYNILARYMIANGTYPAQLNVKTLYPYFAAIIPNAPAKNKSKWLLQLARFIERNQHKQFNLKDFITPASTRTR